MQQMEKKVLDCGAGGDQPPLSLFYEYGYHTYGIELNKEQLEKAEKYANNKMQKLNIEIGNMLNLKFDDRSFPFVYSYNSVFHMKKIDVEKAMNEMRRVLIPGGLLFVNFLSVNDHRCGLGPQVGEHEYEQMDEFPVIHSFYEISEPDIYFEGMEILYREDRTLDRIYEGKKIRQGFVDYIVKKQDCKCQ
jgi:ubiquinone/menaquinone biosynthesis C-methylase UbiE